MRLSTSIVCCLVLGLGGGCDPGDGDPDEAFLRAGVTVDGIEEGSPDALGVLAVANQVALAELKAGVGLSDQAAEAIAAYRLGDDELPGTSDDETFETLAELDAIPFVGTAAFDALLAYARSHGYVPSCISVCVDDTTLYDCAQGGLEVTCPLGCQDDACRPMVAANTRPQVVDSLWFDGVTATLTVPTLQTAIVSTDTGKITMDPLVLRGAGQGPVDGMGFFLDQDHKVAVLLVEAVNVGQGATLRVTGSRPLVVLSRHNVLVTGLVDISASGSAAGPGGTAGGPPNSSSEQCYDSTGGGGGGFGQSGAKGGSGVRGCNGQDRPTQGLSGGRVRGRESLIPLVGGQGGTGGTGSGGGGAGAIQISSFTIIEILRKDTRPTGIRASGGGGRGGGGSGGAILLDAPRIRLGEGVVVAANGGAASGEAGTFGVEPAGGNACGAGGCLLTTPLPACAAGRGGGGGAGRIRFNASPLFLQTDGAIVSPLPSVGVPAAELPVFDPADVSGTWLTSSVFGGVDTLVFRIAGARFWALGDTYDQVLGTFHDGIVEGAYRRATWWGSVETGDVRWTLVGSEVTAARLKEERRRTGQTRWTEYAERTLGSTFVTPTLQSRLDDLQAANP